MNRASELRWSQELRKEIAEADVVLATDDETAAEDDDSWYVVLGREVLEMIRDSGLSSGLRVVRLHLDTELEYLVAAVAVLKGVDLKKHGARIPLSDPAWGGP